MTSPPAPLIIVDGATDVTGALISASAQARMLGDRIRTILVLPSGHRVPVARTADFQQVCAIPMVTLRKNLISICLYFPGLLLSAIYLRRLISRTRCERVQFNDFSMPQGALLRLMGYRGLIVTFVRIDTRRFGLAGRLWLAAARWASDEMISVSHFIQGTLLPKTPSRVIYGETAVDPFLRSRPDLSRPTLLFVGNYIRGKGQEHAIAAFHRIAKSHPASRLRFVGGDMGLNKNIQFRVELEQLANFGPAANQIEFFGQANDMRPYLANAYAALNLSESESFSRTCLEASAAGLAVIATRCGGPEEIIDHEKTGFLVECGDVQSMAERMDWLLNHPAEAKAMGAAGKSLIQRRFSRRGATKAFVRLLRLD